MNTSATTPLEVKTVRSLTELSAADAAAWDQTLAAGNPFVRHAFLTHLERTGCVGAERGWLPCHQLVFCSGRLVGAMPLYLKADSYGEYIFDWRWAEGAQAHGLPYYPKLVSAIPFTPASGPRLLRAPEVSLAELLGALLPALTCLQRASSASGVHVLFCSAEEQAALAEAGFIARASMQYHFARQPQWKHFDDFLAAMRAPSRKQMRRERERAQGHGLRLSYRPVKELSAADLAALHTCYRRTVWEKGALAYLTPEFFTELVALGDDVAYVAMAHRDDAPVAAALFFRGTTTLYGRYWGSHEALDALHFELCYYMPIAWSLEHGIDRFEAGAQGEHKIKRGFLPAPCYSAHRLTHPGLHHAVVDYCAQEARGLGEQMEALRAHGPFPRG